MLTQDRRLGDWFEAVVAAGAEPKAASNWIMTDVLGALREFRIELDELRIAPTGLAALLALLAQKALTAVAAKKVFAHMHQHGSDAAASMRALGLERIAEPETLQPLVEASIAALPKAADDVRNGVEKPLDALKGHVMRATKGRADPAIVDRLLRDTIARS